MRSGVFGGPRRAPREAGRLANAGGSREPVAPPPRIDYLLLLFGKARTLVRLLPRVEFILVLAQLSLEFIDA